MNRELFFAVQLVVFAVLASAAHASCNQRLAYIKGDSMNPIITEDTRVYYDSHKKEANTGDILILAYKEKYTVNTKQQNKHFTWLVHRVYAHVKGGFITKGDNNDSYDNERFTTEQIVGTVCKISL